MGVSGQVRVRVNCKGEGPRRGCGTQLEVLSTWQAACRQRRGASGLGIGPEAAGLGARDRGRYTAASGGLA